MLLEKLNFQQALELLVDMNKFWGTVNEMYLAFKMFPFVYEMFPDEALKIIGMLLENDVFDIVQLVKNPAKLRDKVREAHEVLVLNNKSMPKADTAKFPDDGFCNKNPVSIKGDGSELKCTNGEISKV